MFLLALLSLEKTKEGDKVCFLWDGKKIELICSQQAHPNPSFRSISFQRQLQLIKGHKQTPFLFREDLNPSPYTESKTKSKRENEVTINDFLNAGSYEEITFPSFMEIPIGQNHFKIDPTNGECIEKIADFTFYEKDQEELIYEILEAEKYSDYTIFPHLHVDRIQLSEIHFIESIGVGNVRQLWIIAPHQLDKNVYKSDSGEVIRPEELGEIVITPSTSIRNPTSYMTTKKGHKKRVCAYQHGQYGMIKLSQNANPRFFFNEQGFLTMIHAPETLSD